MKLVRKGPFISAAVALCCTFLATAGAAEKEDQKTLPTAKEILERYGKAVGGKSAFANHNSQHATGTVEMPAQKLKGRMEVWAARPNKLVMTVTIPGIGETTTGFNGEVAWSNNPLLGPMLLEGKAKDQIVTQADFDQALHDPADYTTMQVLGRESFNGEECFKLKLVHRSGFESTEYFSVKTGLQRGFVATQESPLGPISATTVVTDYKQFGDLFMPARISQKAMGVETVMTIEQMEYDKVSPDAFKLPDAVKTLLQKPAQDRTATPAAKESSAGPSAEKEASKKAPR